MVVVTSMTVATANLEPIQERGWEISRSAHPYAYVMRVRSVNISTKATVPVQTRFIVERLINAETR